MDDIRRVVGGPPGPRVVLDGRSVLRLSSDDALGLAGEARVLDAAAEAARRWGVAGVRTAAHAGLETRLAALLGTEAARALGCDRLGRATAVAALAAGGDLVVVDELAQPVLWDGARRSGAEVAAFRHADPDGLAWALRQRAGRRALVVTEGVFAADGDVAPLAELGQVAGRHGAQLVVDESHALGALGPAGAGAGAEAGTPDAIHAVLGSLGTALGAMGAYVCASAQTLAALAGALRAAGPPSPVAAAAAAAALDVLAAEPERLARLRVNAGRLRDELAREGFEVAGSCTQVVPLILGEAAAARRVAALALEEGVDVEALEPPDVPAGTARLRLAVMASHTRGELREAARVLGRAALKAGVRPATTLAVAQARAAGDAGVVPIDVARRRAA